MRKKYVLLGNGSVYGVPPRTVYLHKFLFKMESVIATPDCMSNTLQSDNKIGFIQLDVKFRHVCVIW